MARGPEWQGRNWPGRQSGHRDVPVSRWDGDKGCGVLSPGHLPQVGMMPQLEVPPLLPPSSDSPTRAEVTVTALDWFVFPPRSVSEDTQNTHWENPGEVRGNPGGIRGFSSSDEDRSCCPLEEPPSTKGTLWVPSRGFAAFGSSGAPLLQQLWDFSWESSKTAPPPAQGWIPALSLLRHRLSPRSFGPGIFLVRTKALGWGQSLGTRRDRDPLPPLGPCGCCCSSWDGISGIQPLSVGHLPTLAPMSRGRAWGQEHRGGEEPSPELPWR